MQEENANVLDVLVKAFEASKGKTVDLVVEHGELRGVTPEMFQWWGVNINDSIRYRMWCPEDHISFEWEVPPSEDRRVAPIQRAEEKIGEFPASVLRLRRESPHSLPIPTIYGHFRGSGILGPDDKPIAWVCHEFEETPNGIKVRSTFRFPAKTPQRFLDAMRKHSKTEMGHLPEFLPELYRQNVG